MATQYKILTSIYQPDRFRALVILIFLLGEFTFADQAIANEQNIIISLSDEAHLAINSGVTLSFTCDFAVRESFWLFALNHKKRHHQFILLRHALSNRYIVKRDNLDIPHIFPTIAEATKYITFQAETLLEFYASEENPYSIRLSLNKFELPGPMRLNAFISEEWNLDTGWVLWNFEN